MNAIETLKEILKLIDAYWKFDEAQQPMSSWHDKQDLLKAVSEVKLFATPAVVGRGEQLCQHDRSVTNRICDDCGSVITYVPDQGIKLLQEASELVGNPRTIVMGKPDITCISWQEKYERWLKHSTNILVEVIKCLECGKPSKIPLCFQCFENHYLAHPSRNSGRMNALIRSMIPALKAQQKVGVFGCKDPKEITERLAQEGVIVESEPMLGAKIPRFTHTLEGVEINSIDQKQVGYVFF